jgi:hypothetical protein
MYDKGTQGRVRALVIGVILFAVFYRVNPDDNPSFMCDLLRVLRFWLQVLQGTEQLDAKKQGKCKISMQRPIALAIRRRCAPKSRGCVILAA